MNLSRWLITAGLMLIIAGVFFGLAGRLPGLNRIGRLPGDVRLEKDHYAFYFPWVSCLLLSALFTLIAYLWQRFKG